MVRFRLADLFRPPKRPDADAELDGQLRQLEQEAQHALPGFGAHFLNRAGDLCLQAGKLDRGLGYLGEAIDMYLRAGRWDAAGAVCRKLLRLSPGAVRARCTLAWLAIGKRLGGDAQAQIRDYVQAVHRGGARTMELARKQLALMAEAVSDEGVLELIGAELSRLGDNEGATKVALRLEQLQQAPGGSERDDEHTWATVLRAALLGPQQLAR